jgi:hypothetical protein
MEHTEQDEQKGIVKHEEVDFLYKYKQIASVVLKSGLTPLETEDQVLAAILFGQELGLKPMSSVQNIVPVNGKITLSVAIMNSIALRNGVVWKVAKDYEVYKQYFDAHRNYYLEEEVLAKVAAKEWQLASLADVKNPETLEKLKAENKKVIMFTADDRITTIKGRRTFPNGEILEHEFSFLYSEAVNSKLVREGSIWEKRPKLMCFNRALGGLLKLLVADFLNGAYETTEILDIAPETMDYDLDEQGTAKKI